jgi:hypothetical protein
MTAECGLAGEQCAKDNVPEEECIELAECRRRADDRQAICTRVIQEQP